MKMRFKYLFLIVALFILPLALGEVNKQYQLDLHYSYGELELKNLQIVVGQDNHFNGNGLYAAEIVSHDNKALNISFFGIPNIIFYDSVDEETGQISGGGMVELNETELTLTLPYSENAKEINLYDKDLKLLLNVDVGKYSKVVEEKEVKGVIKEEMVKEVKIEDKKISSFWLILTIVVVLFIIIFIIIRSRKK